MCDVSVRSAPKRHTLGRAGPITASRRWPAEATSTCCSTSAITGDDNAVPEALTDRGAHRSAGPVDLLVAATAEEHRLALLHDDADFRQVAEVTGQEVRWVAEAVSVN
ncbi:PIN domain-containing protein [Actinoplanes palleronii]|uniref:PIN domain-containing protein n=1 Tax=Actinoplanes palleronii TaxID=113570 RepID=A0ABQ4B1V2_9ACTN|nr:PIN domain-containing protein [Actinoplanes palleronii]GIE64640.1 hypothetical protein Apa02nite_007480 [Actinoplanes palleronii]